MLPSISVVIPAFNAGKYVRKSIDSILSQTLRNIEVIVINDASTDDTGKILEEIMRTDSRVRVITNEKNLNIAESLNLGIKASLADLIARMDADDVALNHRLETQFKLLTSLNNTAVVGSDIRIIDENGAVLGVRKYPQSSESLKKVMFRYSPFAHPAVLFRKSSFERAGGYNKIYSPTEDLDLWFRMGLKEDFASVPEVLLDYRVFPTSSSHAKLKSVEIKVFKIRVNAVKLGYRPSVYDIIYNFFQFLTLWFTPSSLRIKAYNLVRNRGLI